MGGGGGGLIGAIVGAVGSVFGQSWGQQESNDGYKEMAAVQKQQQAVSMAQTQQEAARDRRAQIREARIKRAMVENTAAATGQGAGSAATVGGQVVTGQAGMNVGNINTATSFSNIKGNLNQDYADAQLKSQTPMSAGGSILSSLGQGIMGAGLQSFTKSIFK